MAFWQNSTTQQKLAQVDGALELGMTGAQLAMNVGSTDNAVRVFANRHGRKFGVGYKDTPAMVTANQSKAVRKLRQRAEFFSSAPVNSRLAKIFPEEIDNGNLFDDLPYEDGAFQ